MRDETGSVRISCRVLALVFATCVNGQVDAKLDHDEADAPFGAPGDVADGLDLDLVQSNLPPLGDGVERERVAGRDRRDQQIFGRPHAGYAAAKLRRRRRLERALPLGGKTDAAPGERR